jgi:hypothetical protein
MSMSCMQIRNRVVAGRDGDEHRSHVRKARVSKHSRPLHKRAQRMHRVFSPRSSRHHIHEHVRNILPVRGDALTQRPQLLEVCLQN